LAVCKFALEPVLFSNKT